MCYEKNRLELNGIKEVVSYDDKEVVLTLCDKGMVIRGTELSVAELNLKTGLLRIDGQVLLITYTKAHEKQSVLKKIFK